MEKKTQTFSKDFKMPRLYRDDLELIENIIINELKPGEYKLETKDFESDRLESIPKDAEQTTDLHIQTHRPHISIDFNRFSTRVYAGDDDLSTTGALTKIIEILSRKERNVLYWSQEVAVWLAPILFIVPIRTLIEIGEIKSTKHWITFGVSLFALIWWIISFYSSRHGFSKIIFNTSKERMGFIRRNKDQIIIGFIVAIPVAIFSFLLGYFLK